MKYVKDNILNYVGKEAYVVMHGVNCRNAMGSGVAKVLSDAYPEVKKQYHELFDAIDRDEWDLLLGSTSVVPVGDSIVINAFTQCRYGRDKKRYASIDAIKQCIDFVIDFLLEDGKTLVIPKIGTGLGGIPLSEFNEIVRNYDDRLIVLEY